ncbi:hypothetical protein ACFQ3T_33925, partial [Saccharothrix hoggarensis]
MDPKQADSGRAGSTATGSTPTDSGRADSGRADSGRTDSGRAESKLAEELRLLLDAAAERAQPWLHRMAAEGGHDSRTCGWCPLCNAVALVRGDRSELAAKAAEHIAGLIAVLR